MIRAVCFTSLLVLLFSCKKDKLEGDAAMLLGKWNWTSSTLVSNYCDPDSSWIRKIDSESNEASNYSLEFLEKGKVIFRHNGGKVWNNRLVFESIEALNDSLYTHKFIIHLNNRSDEPMIIWLGQDHLMMHDYPKDTDQECEEMFNHFVRA